MNTHGTRTSWPGLVAAVIAISALFAFDLTDSPGKVHYVGLYAVIPALAATLVRPAAVAGLGLFAFTMAVAGLQLVPHTPADARSQELRLLAILLVSVLSMMVAAVRQQREADLLELNAVTQVLRQTILRPVPPRVADVPVAVEYVAASEVAQVGGDLYEVVDTRFGVRALIGDVRGKGIEAVRLASVVLASFREAAHREDDLGSVAEAMDATVRREAVSEEDFVTATLLELTPDGTVAVAQCGHPAPLLLSGSDAGAHLLGAPPAAPLGLGERPEVTRHTLAPGQRLLLYTDGVSEARADGVFFPLEAEAVAAFTDRSLRDGARHLCRAVGRYAGRGLHDDISLMALEVPPAQTPAGHRRLPPTVGSAATEAGSEH